MYVRAFDTLVPGTNSVSSLNVKRHVLEERYVIRQGCSTATYPLILPLLRGACMFVHFFNNLAVFAVCFRRKIPLYIYNK